MNKCFLGRSAFAGACVFAACAAVQSASACTGVTLKAENGDIVSGRTMEWGASNIDSKVLVIPRGTDFKSSVEGVKDPFSWKTSYGIVGFSAFGTGYLTDGMNEAGLVVGGFYHSGYACYADLTSANASRAISPDDVILYVLGTSKNVSEARANLEKIALVKSIDKNLKIVIPLHLMLSDGTGKQTVVEWTDGKMKFFDAEGTRVITNDPNYDWHLTNLDNFVNLRAVPADSRTFANVTVAPLGVGSGMLGIPGDFTPPSRFVRAFAFSKTARPLPDGNEAIYELFRILDNFNVPLPAATGKAAELIKGLRSSTAWTSAYDIARKRLYYHTQNDRQVQLVDLSRIDFGKFDKTLTLPLGPVEQCVKDRTPSL